jgi:hypothetical protein
MRKKDVHRNPMNAHTNQSLQSLLTDAAPQSVHSPSPQPHAACAATYRGSPFPLPPISSARVGGYSGGASWPARFSRDARLEEAHARVEKLAAGREVTSGRDPGKKVWERGKRPARSLEGKPTAGARVRRGVWRPAARASASAHGRREPSGGGDTAMGK